MDAPRQCDVVIIGGGVIGLGIAWRAAAGGLSVTLCDPAPTEAASRAAGGMLAPITEVHYGEIPIMELNIDSINRYPQFVAELEQATGLSVDHRTTGTLQVAFDADDREALVKLAEYQGSLGLDVEMISGRAARELEPMLAPRIRSALMVRADHSIDNRKLAAALLAAASSSGAEIVRNAVAEVLVDGDAVTGVRLADGPLINAGRVVVAAGAFSHDLPGLPEAVRPPVHPIKGQIIHLRPRTGNALIVEHTVRAFVRSTPVYLIPRSDGEIVVGATVEELGFDSSVTAGGVYQLLRDAIALMPAVSELALTETFSALRPGTPDNAPLLGPTAIDGLIMATGHFRHGILLTPVTVDSIGELLLTEKVPAAIAPFTPGRFA